jgi:hypothetical protein
LTRPWPPPLEPPATLTGGLQRGTGAGFRQALGEAPDVATDALTTCLRDDPRWDRQLDRRARQYAALLRHLGLPLDMLGEWLRTGGSDGDPDRNLELVLDVLQELAARGDEEARAMLREYVGYGDMWSEALDALVHDPHEFDPLPDWERAVEGLDAVILERFGGPDSLEQELESAQLTWDRPPWSRWRAENPRFAAVEEALNPPAPPRIGKRRRAPALGTLTTEELLEVDDRSRWPKAVRLLLARPDLDRARLREVALRRDAPNRHVAIAALAQLGDPAVLDLVPEIDETTPRPLDRTVTDALVRLPREVTADLAREWLLSELAIRRTRAAMILEAHAQPEDAARIRGALAAELDRGLDGNQYVVSTLSTALERVPGCGPFAELARAFAETPYSYGRHFAAEALAKTDSDFPETFAVDCLYDCELETQEIGLRAVSLEAAGGRDGLEWLAGNPFAERELRSSAAARLGGEA